MISYAKKDSALFRIFKTCLRPKPVIVNNISTTDYTTLIASMIQEDAIKKQVDTIVSMSDFRLLFRLLGLALCFLCLGINLCSFRRQLLNSSLVLAFALD